MNQSMNTSGWGLFIACPDSGLILLHWMEFLVEESDLAVCMRVAKAIDDEER